MVLALRFLLLHLSLFSYCEIPFPFTRFPSSFCHKVNGSLLRYLVGKFPFSTQHHIEMLTLHQATSIPSTASFSKFHPIQPTVQPINNDTIYQTTIHKRIQSMCPNTWHRPWIRLPAESSETYLYLTLDLPHSLVFNISISTSQDSFLCHQTLGCSVIKSAG